ncbi:putative formamidopyrimidine-DNA glycosylase-like protein [Anatilimnocola aggregata]|uniref:Putative formamidopyrimidine-DNA glycosylase-like protein n=1 Tax=Anatilimnocola aggregata TaxID=2528021 RepID=A0A517YFW9_9BACT|nr:DNA-formamidopyrimidine glycosylase family protein [Anatilimnocola aggregata]QDU29118.1 putative formamidopyrimidine-DNA glycosylase-like protein [Anatilimnocola aggregata]
MPELPDLESYLVALRKRLEGQTLEQVTVRSPFVLRTFDPPIESLIGLPLERLTRLGKRIVWHFPHELFLVVHLMIAGRFHWKDRHVAAKGKNDLAAFRFAAGTLLLTEASPKKRASLHVLQGWPAVQALHRGGIEPLACSLAEFCAVLRSENHTLKRSLADPRLFSGIGNAYSDEILHTARLSPLQWTSRLSDEQIAVLFAAVQRVLAKWRDRLCAEAAQRFPEKVTAFRPEMAVHGKFGQPCPACGHTVQRIVYAENECNYCPTCQTDGRLLADRSLSRLLKDDWPRTIEEWEEQRGRS